MYSYPELVVKKQKNHVVFHLILALISLYFAEEILPR